MADMNDEFLKASEASGHIQVVLIPAIQPAFNAWLESKNCELFQMPTSEDDLPTFGIGPKELRRG